MGSCAVLGCATSFSALAKVHGALHGSESHANWLKFSPRADGAPLGLRERWVGVSINIYVSRRPRVSRRSVLDQVQRPHPGDLAKRQVQFASSSGVVSTASFPKSHPFCGAADDLTLADTCFLGFAGFPGFLKKRSCLHPHGILSSY